MIETIRIARQRWWSLTAFAVLFRGIESMVFAPIAAIAGGWLIGRSVLDSTAIVGFLLSWRGLAALVLAATLLLAIRLLEHAGLSAMLFAGATDRRLSSLAALRMVGLRLPTLVRLGARLALAGLTCLLPVLAVAGGFAAWLLPAHDINYYLKLQPPAFKVAAAGIGLAALVSAALLLALFVRWRLVVHAVMFENAGPGAAMARSAALTAGQRGRVAGLVLAVSLLIVALGALGAAAGGLATRAVLAALGPIDALSVAGLAAGLLLLFALRTVVGIAFTLAGSVADAGAATAFYRERCAAMGGGMALPDAGMPDQPRGFGWMPAGFAAALLVSAGGGTRLALQAIGDARPVSIQAHRGVTGPGAPENTLPAVAAAIAAGADTIETDVQMSRDGVLVMAHDSDFSRTGGVARKVWDLDYAQIRRIPLGGTRQIAPTLGDFLAAAKGRARVNIELKHYGNHQPGLAARVVAAVNAAGMAGDVVIQSLEFAPLAQVRAAAPQIPIGYLLSFNVRDPSRLAVDFIAVEQSRIDRSFIARSHRRGQLVYAWTVNSQADMERLIDLGIDGLITDEAALAAQVRDSDAGDRALRQINALLAG